jgi:hypothetical protein
VLPVVTKNVTLKVIEIDSLADRACEVWAGIGLSTPDSVPLLGQWID